MFIEDYLFLIANKKLDNLKTNIRNKKATLIRVAFFIILGKLKNFLN
jgi:hypothetical protein